MQTYQESIRMRAWPTPIRSERSPVSPGSARRPSTACSTSGPGVRASTAANVAQAIADLDRQRSQLRLTGRTFIVDLVMQTPDRFSAAVKSALELELPMLRPAVVRSSFDFRETARPGELVRALDGIRRRGSSGVILKAPDEPEIGEAIGRLHDAGIPVVTLVTDIPLSQRVAYVGIDNRAAGATAAYLMDQWLPAGDEAILMALSRSAFRGEEEREMGFRSRHAGTSGWAGPRRGHRHRRPRPAVRDETIAILRDHPEITAVYSIGGGNRAILDAFDSVGRECRVFVAHDLDRDNLSLIQDRQDHRGAAPRPAPRHAPRLSRDHAGERRHRRADRVHRVADQRRHALTQHPGSTGPVISGRDTAPARVHLEPGVSDERCFWH